MAPILNTTGSENDPTYEVAFFAGKVSSRSKSPVKEALQTADLKDLKLEIVFVIDTTGSMTPAIKGAVSVMEKCTEQLSTLPGVKGQGAVRFGLVQYRDKGDLFVSQKVSDLTSNIETFIAALRNLRKRTAGGGDIPEQVLEGLKTAIEKTTWSKLSSKHIILLGDAPAHIGSKSTTGGTIEDIINLGRKSGVKSNFQTLNQSIAFHSLLASSHSMARRQFEVIAKNNGDEAGYFKQFDANDETSRGQAVEGIVRLFGRAIKALAVTRTGGAPPEKVGGKEGEIEQIVYKYNGAGGGREGAIKPVEIGWAFERSKESEREVAQKKVMVTKTELVRLADDLDYLHRKFSRLTKPEDRRDVSDILDALKGSALERVSGQKVTTTTNLQQLIGDLPLHTPVLNTTIQDIAKLTTEEYTKFIENLERMQGRAEVLLRSKEWIVLSSGFADDETYLILRMAEMP